MVRPPGRSVALAFVAALAAHVALAGRGLHERWWQPGETAQNLVWLGLSLGVALVGRLFLAYLPPGPTGAHDARGIAETWAASLALGWLAIAAAWTPLTRLWLALADAEQHALARAVPFAVPAALVALLALARWLTLPGAMVPRHSVERPGASPSHRAALVVVLAWLAFALGTGAFLQALVWTALAVLVERALLCARRNSLGRALVLCFVATVPNPSGGALAGVTVALGTGATYLVPWLRRADRRAGVLAALFLAAPLLRGWEPLALAGPVVLVAASHRAQRRFALAAASGACLAFALLGSWSAPPARERLLLADELARIALDVGAWGLAWPATLAALAIGALAFPKRPGPWTPGAIDPPRREALAVAALVALLAAVLALPLSPWGESDALVILFAPCALLAGLVVLPPERA